ncbi:hypothetical protein BJ508DRAFT_377048 [Ascobolus immersus RN42]|uniref:Citrate synthase n=1 Tax=Ascobolus immersus RN42 TaxID=1160509 RepID=A0A3N4I8S4_ASCIM|nr:hypothetical protein BJ508DRAFT_377048 [Ascobolus immersus RN42]
MAVIKEQPNPQESITVTDNRTGKTVTIPITNNSIPATAFTALKAPTTAGKRQEDDLGNGIRVYDPGFMNTAAIKSRITYIDGDAGELRHRGYPIEQLAERSTYLETAYLLIYGHLPDASQSKIWEYEVMHHTFLSEDLTSLLRSMRYDSHPMSIFITAFSSLSAYHPEANPSLAGQNLYTTSPELLNKQVIRALGKSSTIAALSLRIRMNRPAIAPRADLTYTENLLYMMDALSPADPYRPDPRLAKALDTLFILHADHEMNCSTAAMVHVGSSRVDPYSAIAAAASALYGPLHGGANEAVIRMLQRIGSVDRVPAFLEGVKKKKELLFGFGHRVYRNTDPRSTIIRKVAEEVFSILGRDPDGLIEIAQALRDAALKDPYFVERKLYPNVDYWSGLIYKTMGFPLDFFPVLFAVPRVSGWLAHWKQNLEEGTGKIWRPRQVYVGEGRRDYVELGEREARKVEDSREGVRELPHYQSRRRGPRGGVPAKL